jgi:DNA/RNA endonuclease G (NUC1)
VLNYKIKLTEDAGGHVLNVTDWMYLAPNGAIVNRSQFRKFGIKVAELVATMRPAGAANP